MEGDHDLVALARQGSTEAAAALFERHWRPAWRLAYGLTGSAENADDTAQLAFERALRGLGSFNGRASFGTWLGRIVINAAHDERRRSSRALPTVVEPSPGAPPAADTDVLAAVAALPAERRGPIVLRYWLDWTPAEIAEALEMPVGTVHSRLARGLAELRTRLEVGDVARS
ncbi:MAG: RNA polymerase sigma factor [Gaiellaceae bacterium]